MTLTDALSTEQWENLVKEIQEKFGLDCEVSDPGGNHVTHAGKCCNKLCPEIKNKPEALSSICGIAAQNFTAQARQTGEPVIGECDAGMLKLSAPVFSGKEFLGTIGGCGSLLEDGEVEDFLVQKTTGLSEETIAKLMESIPVMTEARAGECAAYIQKRLAELLS